MAVRLTPKEKTGFEERERRW